MAAWRSVQSIVKKILWVAVQVAGFLSKGMFLTKSILAFSWMGMGKASKEAGLMAVA